MPIEIKELYIKINVNDSAQNNASEQKVSGGSKDEIVKACVEQMAHITQRKKER